MSAHKYLSSSTYHMEQNGFATLHTLCSAWSFCNILSGRSLTHLQNVWQSPTSLPPHTFSWYAAPRSGLHRPEGYSGSQWSGLFVFPERSKSLSSIRVRNCWPLYLVPMSGHIKRQKRIHIYSVEKFPVICQTIAKAGCASTFEKTLHRSIHHLENSLYGQAVSA